MKEHERLEYNFVKEMYTEEYPMDSTYSFNCAMDDYQNNIVTEKTQLIKRAKATYAFDQAFRMLGVDNSSKLFTERMIKLTQRTDIDIKTSNIDINDINSMYTIRFDIRGLTSDLFEFSTEGNSCVLVYKPQGLKLDEDSFKAYISNLGSPWDFDSLIKEIHLKVSKALNVYDVYVALNNIKYNNSVKSFETFSGAFNDPNCRAGIFNS